MSKIPTMILVVLIAMVVSSKAQTQFREFKPPRETSQISNKPIIEFDEKMTSAQKEIATKIIEDDFMEFSGKGNSYVENHKEEIEQKIKNDLRTNFQQKSFFGCPNPHFHILWVNCGKCGWKLVIFFSCFC